jgi:hypothetical protein
MAEFYRLTGEMKSAWPFREDKGAHHENRLLTSIKLANQRIGSAPPPTSGCAG